MSKSWRADFTFVGFIAAVGDKIDAELTLRRFDGGINLAGRHLEAFGVKLEVMDQPFHRALHVVASRWRNILVGDNDESLSVRRVQFLDALLHDADRLPHLFHADAVAIVVVAVLADRNIEIELGINLVGLRLAQIPRRSRTAHHHAGEPARPGVLKRNNADIDVALFEDAVLGQQLFKIVADFQERIAERRNIVDQLRRQILMHAADAEISGMHPRAGSALVEAHKLLALLEAPERRGERTDVHCLRGDIENVRQQPADFRIKYADNLAAPRHRNVEQLFGGQTERVLLVHRRDVVKPVEIRNRLQIGLLLDQLFSATMQQADMRIDTLDDFTVELQHQAQHAVSCRMLRPEVDCEIALRSGGFSHHATFASFAALSARRALNLSHIITKRSCRPSPIRSMPSCALTLNVIRWPMISAHSTSTVTVMPGSVAARWLTSTCTPRLPSPGSRCGASSCVHTHSISTIMLPVANTLGIDAISGASG